MSPESPARRGRERADKERPGRLVEGDFAVDCQAVVAFVVLAKRDGSELFRDNAAKRKIRPRHTASELAGWACANAT